MSKKIQIDVNKEVSGTALMECSLYVDGGVAAKVFITKSDYERLTAEGFFLRSGNKENCGAINTSSVYCEQ